MKKILLTTAVAIVLVALGHPVAAQGTGGSFGSGSTGSQLEDEVEAKWSIGGKICSRQPNTILVQDRDGGKCTNLFCEAPANPAVPEPCTIDANCGDCRDDTLRFLEFTVPGGTTADPHDFELYIGCNGSKLTAYFGLDGASVSEIDEGTFTFGEIQIRSGLTTGLPASEPLGMIIAALAVAGLLWLTLRNTAA